jgi:hypothetical protein
MRCHQHLDSEAVAICVSCGRGLCRACQQPTLDQRMLCGMPQCEGFAKGQASVQFATRQSCSNEAAQYQMIGALLRALSLIIFIPSALLVLVMVVWIGLHPLTSTAESFALVVLGIILIFVAGLLWRFQGRILLLQKNWEDLSSEFRGRDVEERPEAELPSD